MSERLTPLNHLRHARDMGKMVLLDWLDRQDTKLASALNPPEVNYPRIYVDAEAPVATEEELGGIA